MKENMKNKMLSLTEKAIRLEIDRNKIPICPLVFHQPKRPKRK